MKRHEANRTPTTDDVSTSSNSRDVSTASSRSSTSWFPPVTHQLRLRSITAVSFVASNNLRRGHSQGRFRMTFHTEMGSDPFWSSAWWSWSKDRLQDRLCWTDVELDKSKVHSGIDYLVVRVWFSPAPATCGDNQLTTHATPGEETLEVTWGVHLSGLACLGTRPPLHGRLPADAIVFVMSGYYFTAPSKKHLSRHLFLRTPRAPGQAGGAQGHPASSNIEAPLPKRSVPAPLNLATKSYDTALVLRLHRMQRALHQIETSNSRLKLELRNKGVIEESEIDDRLAAPRQEAKKSSLLVRERDFFSHKSKTSRSRVEETHLQMQLESLYIRLDLLKKEVTEKKKDIESEKNRAKLAAASNSQRLSVIGERERWVVEDKNDFVMWKEEFRVSAKHAENRANAFKEVKLNLVRGLSELYPISCHNQPQASATIRWVTLPDAGHQLREYGMKKAEDVSVAIGWLAHLVHRTGCELGIPLRYPIRLLGSASTILDPSKEPREEYPLHMPKGPNNATADRFELGVFLLAKNISQLRWYFGRQTNDLKPILRNVSELLSLGKSNEELERVLMVLPPSKGAAASLGPPPPSTSLEKQKMAVLEDQKRSSYNEGEVTSSNGCHIEVGIEATESKLSELMKSNVIVSDSAAGNGNSRRVIKSPQRLSPSHKSVKHGH